MNRPKQRGNRALVLIVIGLVAALGLGVVGAALYQGVRSGKVAQQVVDDYLTALEERRTNDAYLMLCPDTRLRHSRMAFESAVDARPPTEHELTGELRVNRSLRGATGTVGVSVTDADGVSDAYMVSLVRQDGDWFICGDPYCRRRDE